MMIKMIIALKDNKIITLIIQPEWSSLENMNADYK